MSSSVSRTQLSIAICLLASFALTVDCYWWSLASSPVRDALIVGTQPLECSELGGLSRNQRALCQKYAGLMRYVSTGAEAGINECKFQFTRNRWNCSTVDDGSVFGKVLKIGSRETAFTYAVSAAGVVVAVARACKTGQLTECGCSQEQRPEGLSRSWKWAGCGDNTQYAYGFAREFIDARERDNVSPRNVMERARKLMNLHNNEAGRMLAVHSSRPACKCHGVSGACNLKTCWMEIPNFHEIGGRLKEKYDQAIEVQPRRRGRQLRSRRPTDAVDATSLVYLDSSPDYCVRNRRTGVKGTRNRECKVDSDGPEGCGLMCCGRGHRTYRTEVVEQCDCKFRWCCTVECKTCRRQVTRHVCR